MAAWGQGPGEELSAHLHLSHTALLATASGLKKSYQLLPALATNRPPSIATSIGVDLLPW